VYRRIRRATNASSFRSANGEHLALRALLFGLIVPLVAPLNPQWPITGHHSLSVFATYVLLWPVIIIAAVGFGFVLEPTKLRLRHWKRDGIRNAAAGACAGAIGSTLAVVAFSLYLLYSVPEVWVWLASILLGSLAVGAVSGALANALAVRWVAAITFLIYLALFASFKLYQNNFRLSYVPDGLHVAKVIYAKEESASPLSFGLPGENETGLIVYELPLSTAQEIKGAGIEYFRSLPPNAGKDRDSRGAYWEWLQTPMWDADWLREPASTTTSATPRVDFYLGTYGFGIALEPHIEELVNEAVSRPGSYFGRGRSGILIVKPDRQRVVFLYAG